MNLRKCWENQAGTLSEVILSHLICVVITQNRLIGLGEGAGCMQKA